MDRAEKDRPGLLLEDHSDIRLVEDARRDVWFRKVLPRTEKQKAALRKAALAAVEAYRARKEVVAASVADQTDTASVPAERPERDRK